MWVLIDSEMYYYQMFPLGTYVPSGIKIEMQYAS